jgi:hypothetical protein
MATFGIRWWDGYFWVHIMWMHWKTKAWCSQRCQSRYRYRSLERALLSCQNAGAVIIFPV